MKNIEISRQQSVTILFILFCLAGYIFFPINGNFQAKTSMLIFLGVLPFLYNRYFLKGPDLLRRINIGNWKKNIAYLITGLILALLVMAVIFAATNLKWHYFLPKNVKSDFIKFLLYEFGGIALMSFLYEFFFRGFVMKYFSDLKKWSILVQFSFFCVMLLMIWGVPYWYYVVYLVFTPFAGWIAYKSDSILYSFVSQWLFIMFIDAAFIALVVNK